MLRSLHIACLMLFASGIAIEKVAANPHFDLVLMDLKMPVMDGLEATRLLRDMLESNVLPIIALTANAVQEELEKCKEVGMGAWVTKPVDAEELFATMHQVLHKKNRT
jgi:CheY-like chemotaxis protein